MSFVLYAKRPFSLKYSIYPTQHIKSRRCFTGMKKFTKLAVMLVMLWLTACAANTSVQTAEADMIVFRSPT